MNRPAMTRSLPKHPLAWLLAFTGAAISLFLYLPFVVYVTNLDEVDTGKELIFTYGLIASMVFVAILSIFSISKKTRYFLVITTQISVLLIFVISLFPNSPGELAGFSPDQFGESDYLAIAKLVSLLGLSLFVAQRYPKQFHDAANMISIFVIGISFMLGIFLTSAADMERQKDIESKMPFIELGTESNIIVLLLDSFTGFRMVEILNERSDLREKFDGFTLYPKAIAPALNTPAGSSIILTGEMKYAVSETKPLLRESKSLDDSFVADAVNMGYEAAYISVLRVNSDKIPSHYERTLFSGQKPDLKQGTRAYFDFLFISLARVIPKRISNYMGTLSNRVLHKPSSKENDRDILQGLSNPAISRPLRSKLSFEYFVDNLYVGEAEKKVIYYLSKISHPHWNFTESGEFQLNAGWQSSSIYVVSEISRFLDKLKSLNSYSNTLLIITSDHGGIPIEDNSMLLPIKFNPLVMIKPVAASNILQVSGMTVWLADVAATVRDHLGVEQDMTLTFPTRSLLQNEVPTRKINIPLFFKPHNLSYRTSLKDWARVDGEGQFEDYGALATTDINVILSRSGVLSLNAKLNEFRTGLVKRNWFPGSGPQYSVFVQFNNRAIGNIDDEGIIVLSDAESGFTIKEFNDPVQGFEYLASLKTNKNIFAVGLAIPEGLVKRFFPRATLGVSNNGKFNFVYTNNELGSPSSVLKVTGEYISQSIDWPGSLLTE